MTKNQRDKIRDLIDRNFDRIWELAHGRLSVRGHWEDEELNDLMEAIEEVLSNP